MDLNLSCHANISVVGKVSATVTGRFVQIQDQKIELSTALGIAFQHAEVSTDELRLCTDALHLSTLWGVIGEYLFRYKRDKRDLVLLKCLALLVSLKNNHETLTQRLLEDQPDIDPQPHSSAPTFLQGCGWPQVNLSRDY